MITCVEGSPASKKSQIKFRYNLFTTVNEHNMTVNSIKLLVLNMTAKKENLNQYNDAAQNTFDQEQSY